MEIGKFKGLIQGLGSVGKKQRDLVHDARALSQDAAFGKLDALQY